MNPSDVDSLITTAERLDKMGAFAILVVCSGVLIMFLITAILFLYREWKHARKTVHDLRNEMQKQTAELIRDSEERESRMRTTLQSIDTTLRNFVLWFKASRGDK